MNIILVEDDKALGSTLQKRLIAEGFAVKWVRTKQEALAATLNDGFHLGILDVGLPDGDGFELAESFKSSQLALPIIFLTAMDSAEYRLKGYEIGAEEYIPKPFHFKELMLRINKVLHAKRLIDIKGFKDFVIDFGSHIIEFPDGRKETPTSRDFALLALLIKKSPQVVSREELVSHITASDKVSTNRTVDNSIVRLRQQLGVRGKNYIKSIRGIGYQWQAPLD
ncbi:MAG: response regulator transcription factor [Bdellovibrionales bacterium]|nr:response regulator transcription factor [Bdellovibrionales bacterium]